MIEYYDEFNLAQGLPINNILRFLRHITTFGDENLAVYEFKKNNPGEELTTELKAREEHKYDLYKRFSAIVNGTD